MSEAEQDFYAAGFEAWKAGHKPICDHLDVRGQAFWKAGWLDAQREWYKAHDPGR